MNQSKHPLLQIVEKQKQGQAIGIYSACTANEYVLRACLQRAQKELLSSENFLTSPSP